MSNSELHEQEAIDAAFSVAEQEGFRSAARIVLVVGFFAYSGFIAADWYVYPDYFWELAMTRLVSCVALFSSIFLVNILQGKTLMRAGIVIAIIPALGVVYMTYIVGGGASPYYAGIILAFIFSATAIPWHYSYDVISISISVTAYVFSSYYYDLVNTTGPEYWKDFGGNFIFLSTTSGMCLYVSVSQYLKRKENFRLQYELEKKNREAARLSRSKTEFFSNISHELRTPLTLILGPLRDVLHAESNFTPQVNELLNTAQSNSLRLLRLVNDLLDVMSLEEGKGLKSEAIEAGSVVREFVESVRYAAKAKDIDLSLSCDISETWIEGDRSAFEKVLLNLLSNAMKFTPKGGKINVDCDQEEGRWSLSVSDTGIGISAEDLPYIFERFQQADGSTTRTYTGTGIGLSLVKEFVEAMGGIVDAKSVLGQGTTMSVELPYWTKEIPVKSIANSRAIDAFETMHTAAQQAAFDGEERSVTDALPYREDKATVLVIDDEPAMRKYLGDILKEDYNVIWAVDGEEGLELARTENPELILLDLMIPKVDGLEVCRRLKREDSEIQSKTVLLTARVDEEAKLTALENGADDFLTKPFGAVELKSRLRNLLESARLERSLLSQNENLSSALGDLKQAQAQLIHSEKLNALGSLSAGLLHEINNPLNYSLTAIQLMKLEPTYENSSDFTELVDDIYDGMERIRVIVSDLRAFAYPSEADKQVVFPLAKAIKSALRFTGAELVGVAVTTEFCDADDVLGSESHIVQVLVNLLTNAGKAMTAKVSRATTLHISTYVEQDRIMVKVVDNGIGMDKETLNRIFEPFFTTREVGEGVGLGLSVCHTIIGNHGGRLAAESEPGKGTTLIFDLESCH